MNSVTTDNFWKLYRTLPQHIRKQARQAYQQFLRDPFQQGLHFEEVDKNRHLWSVRVTRGYRVLSYREGDAITWFWIGSHREYEKMIHGR